MANGGKTEPEQELRALELVIAHDADAPAQLDAVLNAIADGIVVADARGLRLYANDAAARMCGFRDARAFMATTPAEIASRWEIWDEHDRPLPHDAMPQIAARRGETAEMLVGFRPVAGGEERWSVIKSRPVFDDAGRVIRVITVIHDETERVRRARADAFLSAADAALALSMQPAEQLEILAMLPVPRLASLARITIDGRGEPAAVHGEVEGDAPHQLRLPLGARGRSRGELVLERSAARGPFQPHETALATELAARAGLLLDNSTLFVETQRALAARDDFIAVASHDMKGPLGAILFAGSLLARAKGIGPDWDRIRRSGESILEAAETMDRLTHDLVDMAALDAGKLSMTHGDHPARDLLADVAKLYEPLASERSLRLEVARGDADGIWVRGDRGRLLQVLGNLVGNAVRHSHHGGAVQLAVRRDGGSARFSVIDGGVGIGQDELARLFDRAARRPAGARASGLGLVIAEALVRAHGGRIWAESEPGQGSRFHFTVPLSASPRAQ